MSAHRAVIRGDARALRFLILCVGGWTVLRVAAHWTPAVPPPPAAATPPWSMPIPVAGLRWSVAVPALAAEPPGRTTLRRLAVADAKAATTDRWIAAAVPTEDATGPTAVGGGADRHSLRAALIARLLPRSPGGASRSAVSRSSADWFPVPAAERAEPGQGRPFWMRRQMAGWSLGGWVYLRGGGRAAPEGIATGGQLGGSQAGMRLGYGFGATGRTRAYARATIAVRRPEQRELAFGLALAPLAHWPVDVAVEQRVAVGKEGRNALAAMISGGVSDVALPHGFRLEAYGQAGVVGARRRDGFADGAIVIDHAIGSDAASPLRLGALAAGAAQPGAARIDVGPRMTLRLPDVGEGSRIALDWRQRIAGDARPANGLALTLASDF